MSLKNIGWLSVKQCVPVKDTRVIIWIDPPDGDGFFTPARRPMGIEGGMAWVTVELTLDESYVTHWMAIDPPEGANGE